MKPSKMIGYANKNKKTYSCHPNKDSWSCDINNVNSNRNNKDTDKSLLK